MSYGSRLNFITENPVTEAYDARQQAISDQKDADLRNTMNQATLLRTVAMAPVELQGAQEDLRGKKQGNDFDASANPVRLDSMKSQADLNKTQAYVAGQTADADIVRGLSQAKEADANATVAAGTVGSRVAGAANQAEGSRLQNLRTTGQIADDQTDRTNKATVFSQDQLGAKTQAEENVFLRAIQDPEAAIAEGKAAGVVTTPQQEAVIRNPVLRNAAASLISQLRAQSNDPAWRDAEFKKLFANIANQPGGAVQGALQSALEAAKADAPGQAGAKSPGLVTLYDPGGKPKTYRENDPAIDDAIKSGFTTAAPKSGSVLTQVGTDANGQPVFDYVATAPKMTEDQSKAMNFSARMEASSPIIDKFEQQGADYLARAADTLPAGVGNYMQTPEYQQYRQAKEDFLRAVLRKESGAAISEGEIVGGDRQYFPMPGDGPDVIAQKRQNRRVALEAMKSTAGPGATLIPGIIDRATAKPGQQGAAPAAQGQPAPAAPHPSTMSDDDIVKALQN